MATWVCPICGFMHEGDIPPQECPICSIPAERFEKKEDKE